MTEKSEPKSKYQSKAKISPWEKDTTETMSDIAVGKKKYPFRLAGDRNAVSGCLESHELAGSDHVPFLLSLPAQSALGLVKDLVNGRVTLNQEGELEPCR